MNAEMSIGGIATGPRGPAVLRRTGHKRHNLQPSFRESSDSLRQQAASTNLPMPSTSASGNGVYALALCAIAPQIVSESSSSGLESGLHPCWILPGELRLRGRVHSDGGTVFVGESRWSKREGVLMVHPFKEVIEEMRPRLLEGVDRSLFQVALTRRAWCLENPNEDQRHHESLEWLGDRILGAIVAQELWSRYPFGEPKTLDAIRNVATSAGPLATAARRIRLADAIRAGEGEVLQGQVDGDKPLSDHIEALVGAFFLMGGWDGAEHFVRYVLLEHLDLELVQGAAQDARIQRGSAIVELNELVQAIWRRSLSKKRDWSVARVGGTDNEPIHEATVTLPDGTSVSAGPVPGNHQMAMAPTALLAIERIRALM